jgi:hypothetical protein
LQTHTRFLLESFNIFINNFYFYYNLNLKLRETIIYIIHVKKHRNKFLALLHVWQYGNRDLRKLFSELFTNDMQKRQFIPGRDKKVQNQREIPAISVEILSLH